MYLFLAIVLTLLGVLGLLHALGPKTYEVSRSTVIAKPRSAVFTYLNSLKRQDEWSPWAKRDPNMKKKFTGTDGQIGATSYWKGNKEVGEGEQEITGIMEGERIESQLRFLKPFKSVSDAYLVTKDAGEGETEVTWGFKGKNKFPMTIMMLLFMNMDKMIGKDFEEGLSDLKRIMEG